MSGERFVQESEEVLRACGTVRLVGPEDVALLKRVAAAARRRRARICLHGADSDLLHDMVIAHAVGGYDRPHRHLGKDETFHVLEGAASVVLFDAEGNIAARHRLGEGGAALCRVPVGVDHMLVIHSGWFIVHEATNGPFDRARTIFPPWSEEPGTDAAACFLARISEAVSPEEKENTL